MSTNMDINKICVLISSLSFFAYAVHYNRSPRMKSEFKRLGIENFGLLIISLQLLAALGLIVGLKFNSILVISSLGLALLMFFALIYRIKLKDSLWTSLPAFFYMLLNTYIFWTSLN